MNNNDWLDIDVLEDYLDGKLDAKAMHRVERLSLEDPFVAEALAGLSLSPKRTQSLSLLQKQLQERIAQKPVEKKRWQLATHRLSIAASAAVLFVAVSLLFWMRESNNRERIAANTPKKVEVAIAAEAVADKTNVATKSEMDKVIEEAKINTYASQSKKVVKESSRPPIAPVMLSRAAVVDEQPEKKLSQMSSATEIEVMAAPAPRKSMTIIQSQNAILKGVVYGEDSLPLAGASVKLQNAKEATITNTKGEFNLIVDSLVKNYKLNVASLGYMPKELSFKANQNLAIQLKTEAAGLNEIVVVPTAKQAKQSSVAREALGISRLEPLGGRAKFDEYVLNNNKLLVDKKLTGRSILLTFELDKDGKPFNIKVVKTFNMVPGQTKAEENEALRLVKEGPKWMWPNNSEMTTLSGYIEVKF